MVKVINIHGEIKKGREGNRVYQLRHGKQERLPISDKPTETSPLQEKTRIVFREAVLWAKSLTYEEKQALKIYFNEQGLSYNPNFPSNWFNFAKFLFMTKPSFTVINDINMEFRIEHPGISKIEQISSIGEILKSNSGLSSIEDKEFKTIFNDIAVQNNVVIRITTVCNLIYDFNFGIVEPVSEMICGEINCCDPNCVY